MSTSTWHYDFMTAYDESAYLRHYGIIGMKWGVTRRRGSDGLVSGSPLRKDRQANSNQNASNPSQKSGGSSSASASSKSETTPRDFDIIKTLRSKKIEDLSTNDLAEINRRLNLEKSYKDLTKTQKSKGRKLVEEIVVNAGKTALQEFVTNQMKEGLKRFAAPEMAKLFDALDKTGKKGKK